MLLLQNARRERLDGVVFQDRHGSLDDDGTVIADLVDEVDRAPGHLDPVLERLGLTVQSREGREERRVNVEDPISELAESVRCILNF